MADNLESKKHELGVDEVLLAGAVCAQDEAVGLSRSRKETIA
jgi:hypothetical protein